MENNKIAIESKTEDFDLEKHLGKAAIGLLYYLFIYILFILPFKIWGKAATRISLLWETKGIEYNEKEKEYPLFSFYFLYLINFLFDAVILLIWLVGLIIVTSNYITHFENARFLDGYIFKLFCVYISIFAVRFGKEIVFFFLNYIITWLLDVIKNIGLLIKNMWLLNFVYRKKENS